jgi:hypothetical protein
MQTAAGFFEQILFRFGRNCPIPPDDSISEGCASWARKRFQENGFYPIRWFVRAQVSLALQPNWMPGLEAGGTAGASLPARRPPIPRAVARSRIQSQPGDDGKGVPTARVNGDPPTLTAFTVTTKIR